MITTLRNPLELFVSALQFKNREKTRTLSGATQLAELSMQTALRYVWRSIFRVWPRVEVGSGLGYSGRLLVWGMSGSRTWSRCADGRKVCLVFVVLDGLELELGLLRYAMPSDLISNAYHAYR